MVRLEAVFQALEDVKSGVGVACVEALAAGAPRPNDVHRLVADWVSSGRAGERECRRQMRQQHAADALVIVRANQPPGYAKDVEAGCKTAIGS